MQFGHIVGLSIRSFNSYLCFFIISPSESIAHYGSLSALAGFAAFFYIFLSAVCPMPTPIHGLSIFFLGASDGGGEAFVSGHFASVHINKVKKPKSQPLVVVGDANSLTIARGSPTRASKTD